ncbi:MAG: hypothetical protein ACRBBR_16090 [Cellvibrionaceae bacterium]
MHRQIHSRYVGKGLIVLDADLRVNSVYQHHQAGKDWKQEAGLRFSCTALLKLLCN